MQKSPEKYLFTHKNDPKSDIRFVIELSTFFHLKRRYYDIANMQQQLKIAHFLFSHLSIVDV